MRIIEQSSTYILPISPMPTPRPRGRILQPKDKKKSPFVHMYNPPNYTKYKEQVAVLINKIGLQKGDWNTINAVFYIPVPKSFSGKMKLRMHGTLHEKKPDWDNFIKGLMDAVQMRDPDKGIDSCIHDDSCLSSGITRKVWINDPIGKIAFSLSKIELDPLELTMI